MSLTHDVMFSFVNNISVVCGSIWQFSMVCYLEFEKQAISDGSKSENWLYFRELLFRGHCLKGFLLALEISRKYIFISHLIEEAFKWPLSCSSTWGLSKKIRYSFKIYKWYKKNRLPIRALRYVQTRPNHINATLKRIAPHIVFIFILFPMQISYAYKNDKKNLPKAFV